MMSWQLQMSLFISMCVCSECAGDIYNVCVCVYLCGGHKTTLDIALETLSLVGLKDHYLC